MAELYLTLAETIDEVADILFTIAVLTRTITGLIIALTERVLT